MIVLSAATDAIQIDLNATVTTNELQTFASWRDVTATPTYTPGRTLGLSSGTTATSIVAGPAASTQRLVDQLIVHNTDTASATVTLIFYDATNSRVLWKGVLATGETLTYTDGAGYQKIDANGDPIVA